MYIHRKKDSNKVFSIFRFGSRVKYEIKYILFLITIFYSTVYIKKSIAYEMLLLEIAFIL